jgi:hypothetical protein
MRRGAAPRAATEQAIARIAARVPGYMGALVAVDPRGRNAGAAFGRVATRMPTCMPPAACAWIRAILPRRVCLARPRPYACLCCCGWPAEPLCPCTKRCTSTGHVGHVRSWSLTCMCYLWYDRGGGTASTAMLWGEARPIPGMRQTSARAGGGSSTRCAMRRWRARWWLTWSR